MARTTTTLVDARLGEDWDGTTDVSPFIDAAGVVTDRVVACAGNKGNPLTDVEAEMIERLLACHFYQVSDPSYTSRTTGNRSGAFLDNPDEDQTRYMERAILLDVTGCLNNIFKRNFAGIEWLGKPLMDQLSYCERN